MRSSSSYLPSTLSCPLRQLLVSCARLTKNQLTVARPTNFALPPLVQLPATSQRSNLPNKFVSLLTINFKLVREEVRQWMVAWFSVWHNALGDAPTTQARGPATRPTSRVDCNHSVMAGF